MLLVHTYLVSELIMTSFYLDIIYIRGVATERPDPVQGGWLRDCNRWKAGRNWTYVQGFARTENKVGIHLSQNDLSVELSSPIGIQVTGSILQK